MNGWRRLTLHERWIARQREQPGPEEDDRRLAILTVLDWVATAAILGGPILAFLATRR